MAVTSFAPGLLLVVALGACASTAEPTTGAASTSASSTGHTDAAPVGSESVSGTITAITPAEPDAPDAAAPVTPTCATRTPGFFAGKTITAAGETRTYDLFVPEDAAATLPVVFVFHADDGHTLRTALGLEAVTGNKAIVVYPYGNDNSWNLSKPAGNDDYAFVDALKSAVVLSQCADATRTFAFGFSNGGYFVNQMACYRGTGVFRAIAVNSAGLYAPTGAPEQYDEAGDLLCPAPPPAALVIHGTTDASVDYQSEGVYTRNSWMHADACGTSPAAGTPSPCVTYACGTNPVAFCGITGMGHQIWSSAAQATWSFFSRL